MQAVQRVTETLRCEDSRLAEALCFAVDKFVAEPTPQRLQEISDVLRGGLQHTAAELARVKRIAARRKERFRRLKDRKPGFSDGLAAHYDAVNARRDRLEHRRRMLLQVGDGLAWHLMGRNQRLVSSMYAKSTHGISEGVGLGGALLVQDSLHKSGKYFAFENDLARCTSTDDLVVVPVGQIGIEPLLLELKTKGEALEVGVELGVGIVTAHSNAPAHKAMYEEVSAILDSEPWAEPNSTPRAQRQYADLESTSKACLRAQPQRGPSATPSGDAALADNAAGDFSSYAGGICVRRR